MKKLLYTGLFLILAWAGLSLEAQAAPPGGCANPNPNATAWTSSGGPLFQGTDSSPPVLCTLPAGGLNGAFQALWNEINFILTQINPFVNTFDVASYGAKGDGVTNDSTAFTNAATACGTAKGGIILARATGHAYLLNTGWSLPTNCSFLGQSGFHWPATFADNTESDWTSAGTWLHCNDTVNPCITVSGNGSRVGGFAVWYTQPTPANNPCGAPPCTFTHGWTPTTYPYTILMASGGNFNALSDLTIVNGYDCIDIEGQTGGIAGIYTYLNNVFLGCFDRDIKMQRIDNTLSLMNGREQLIWYQNSMDVFGYVEGVAGHGIGWDVNYAANLQVKNWEIDWKQLGILLTDQTVTNGFGSLTFAGANWQVDGMSFNEVCQAMRVASTTTHFAGGGAGNGLGGNMLVNITAFADTNTSKASPQQCASSTPIMFDFRSDNVSVQIHALNVGFADTVAAVGAGSSGYLGLEGMRVQKYSAFDTGQPAFIAANGAYPDIHGEMLNVLPGTSAGPYLQGFGLMPFSMLQEGQANGAAGTARQLCLGTDPASPAVAGPLRRWCLRADASAESGSDAGSNLFLDGYNDAGNFKWGLGAFNRVTGSVAFGGDISNNGSASGTPTIASGFGTGPSITGGNSAGRVTVGSTPGGTGQINFAGTGFSGHAWPNNPACTAQDEVTATPIKAAATIDHVTLSGSMVAADTITYVCIGTQ